MVIQRTVAAAAGPWLHSGNAGGCSSDSSSAGMVNSRAHKRVARGAGEYAGVRSCHSSRARQSSVPAAGGVTARSRVARPPRAAPLWAGHLGDLTAAVRRFGSTRQELGQVPSTVLRRRAITVTQLGVNTSTATESSCLSCRVH